MVPGPHFEHPCPRQRFVYCQTPYRRTQEQQRLVTITIQQQHTGKYKFNNSVTEYRFRFLMQLFLWQKLEEQWGTPLHSIYLEQLSPTLLLWMGYSNPFRDGLFCFSVLMHNVCIFIFPSFMCGIFAWKLGSYSNQILFVFSSRPPNPIWLHEMGMITEYLTCRADHQNKMHCCHLEKLMLQCTTSNFPVYHQTFWYQGDIFLGVIVQD